MIIAHATRARLARARVGLYNNYFRGDSTTQIRQLFFIVTYRNVSKKHFTDIDVLSMHQFFEALTCTSS